MLQPPAPLQTAFYDLLCNNSEVRHFFKNESINGIWFLNPNNEDEIWVTIPFLTCLGYTVIDFRKQVIVWRNIIATSDHSYFAELIADIRVENPTQQLVKTIHFLHKDGSLVPFICKGIAVERKKWQLGSIKKIATESIFQSPDGISTAEVIEQINHFFILNNNFQFKQFLSKQHINETSFSEKFFLGKTFNEIGFSAQLAESIRAILNNALVSKERQELDFMLMVNSEELWYKLIVNQLNDSIEGGELICIVNNITKQHKDELNKTKYFKAIESAHDGVCFLSIEGYCTYANDNYCKMLGRTMEEIIGKHWRTIMLASEINKFDYLVLSELYTKGDYLLSINGVRKSGEIFPASLSLTVTPDLGIICILRDMTEIMQMQKSLNQKDQLLIEFSKEVPISTYLVEENMAGEIHFSFESDDFKQSFPYLLNDQGHFDIVKFIASLHPDDKEVLKYKKNLSKENHLQFSLEARIKNELNIYKWYHVKAQPYLKEANMFKWFGIIEDITQKKLIEDTLSPLQNDVSVALSKYESLLSAGNLGGWEYNIENNELSCSKEYFEMLGLEKKYPARWDKYSIKEVWEELLHPDDLEKAKHVFADYIINSNGNLYEQSFRLKHSDGRWLNILSRGKSILINETNKFSELIVGVHIDVTEFMDVKDALENSKKIISNDNALLNSIINSPKDIYIIALDKSFNYAAISEGYFKHAQYFLLHEPLIGMSVFEVLPKELHESAKMNYERALSGESFSKKNEILSKNGELFYYQNRYSPILDMNGEVTGISMFINDITNERKMAESINMSELRYKALFDGANDAVFIAEAQTGFIVDVNDIACELMGNTKEELVGMHQSELHPPEELNMIIEQFEYFSKTDGPTVFYCSVLHKTGKRIPVRISGTRPFMVNNKLYTAGFFHDCTKENDAKNKTIELTELLSKAEEIAHLGSIEINLISGDRIWSDEFYNILGLKNSKIIPDESFFFKLIHPDDQERFDEWYQVSLNNIGESVPIEIRLTSVDGLDKTLLVSAFTNVDNNGKLSKYISVVKDVTNETLTLNALRKQNKQLKEIAWMQSHLVRAPLSRMLGLIYLLQNEFLEKEEKKEFLGHIKVAADELDTVIKEVVYKANGIEHKLN